MSGPAKTAATVVDLVEVLRELADSKAYRYAHHQLELLDAADDLQQFAERTGLVALLGQDTVQAEISGPFAWVRGHLNDNEPKDDGEPDQSLPSDYTAQLVKQWELDDPRDRWRWTGEPRPAAKHVRTSPHLTMNAPYEPQPEWPERKPYKTPETTIAAFLQLVQLGDAERLAAWLEDRAADAAFLTEYLRAQS
ncbi:hypothetical protein [Bradyrhizobium diazoefficiens]|uniref:hypothetical protein n=1 Tax=Bradyrhizobium diazoefficiens TaxID=1355477 RepID=UPI000575ED59|nr:hypothetical protein [Bradyrhizobium diazoefficiens]